MVKLSKSLLPSDLEQLLMKKSNPRNYSDGPIRDLLTVDCYGKCYICERAGTSLAVEHIKSHHGGKYKELQYDWNNMLTACPRGKTRFYQKQSDIHARV